MILILSANTTDDRKSLLFSFWDEVAKDTLNENY